MQVSVPVRYLAIVSENPAVSITTVPGSSPGLLILIVYYFGSAQYRSLDHQGSILDQVNSQYKGLTLTRAATRACKRACDDFTVYRIPHN